VGAAVVLLLLVHGHPVPVEVALLAEPHAAGGARVGADLLVHDLDVDVEVALLAALVVAVGALVGTALLLLLRRRLPLLRGLVPQRTVALLLFRHRCPSL